MVRYVPLRLVRSVRQPWCQITGKVIQSAMVRYVPLRLVRSVR